MSHRSSPEIVVPDATLEDECESVKREPSRSRSRKRRQGKRSPSGSDSEPAGTPNRLIPPMTSSNISESPRLAPTNRSPHYSPSTLSPMLPSLNLDTEASIEGSDRKTRNKVRSKSRRKKSRTSLAQDTPSVSLSVSTGQLDRTDTSPLSESSPSATSQGLPNDQLNTETMGERWFEHRKKRNRSRNSERQSKANEIKRARNLLLFACENANEDEIRSWSNEEVLKRAKEVEGDILKGTNGEDIWLVDLDQREKSRTLDKTVYEGKEPDLSKEKLESERWTILNRGTIYGYRTVNGKKVLVFAAKFCPYDQMSPEDLDDIKFLARHFHKLGKFFYPVTSNGAMTGGFMFAEGWRVAYEALFSMGLYKKSRNGQGSHEDYAEFLDEMERASAIYAKRYKNLAPSEYLRSRGFMEESCVPCFGTTEPETKAETSFGSNLTVTWGDFCNKYHKDNDAQPRAAGSWFVITDEGELVTDPTLIHNAVKEGYFALPTFKFAVDFSECPGVIDLMWCSEDDFHATSRSVTTPGFRRIGSSIQVPKRVADATTRMKDTPIDQQPIAGKAIRMLELAHDL
ncbi:hypothetical protein RSOLAG22IIIB_11488 [Rhizoctonia solani]|uniref:Tet-like 2OG-Fe(II) oxygenase domain-containing protein n=1 Tax=Rhizoctonia solani TaxID=456999 RepID=A0A0K6G8J4_9AGAM|nr:hypothetical protein RSOLAG22IIIB_11488 [Rhizoctonia solani]